MCDVCKSEGQNYLFRNGPKTVLYTNVLYRVFESSTATIKLCHIHTIELFKFGEKRFLMAHLLFARELAKRSRRVEESPYAKYGF